MNEVGQYLTGMVALAGLVGTVAMWAIRRIVRDEIDRALTPVRKEIADLKRGYGATAWR